MVINPKIVAFATDVAISNLGKIVKLGEGGIKALNVLLKTNGIKIKNDKLEKEIQNCYIEIGKAIVEKKIIINNAIVKDNVEKVKEYNKKIERNKVEISEIKEKAKKEGVSERDFEVVENMYKKFNEQKDQFIKVKNKKRKPKK